MRNAADPTNPTTGPASKTPIRESPWGQPEKAIGRRQVCLLVSRSNVVFPGHLIGCAVRPFDDKPCAPCKFRERVMRVCTLYGSALSGFVLTSPDAHAFIERAASGRCNAGSTALDTREKLTEEAHFEERRGRSRFTWRICCLSVVFRLSLDTDGALPHPPLRHVCLCRRTRSKLEHSWSGRGRGGCDCSRWPLCLCSWTEREVRCRIDKASKLHLGVHSSPWFTHVGLPVAADGLAAWAAI